MPYNALWWFIMLMCIIASCLQNSKKNTIINRANTIHHLCINGPLASAHRWQVHMCLISNMCLDIPCLRYNKMFNHCYVFGICIVQVYWMCWRSVSNRQHSNALRVAPTYRPFWGCRQRYPSPPVRRTVHLADSNTSIRGMTEPQWLIPGIGFVIKPNHYSWY